MDSAPVSMKTFRILFNTCCESWGLSDLKYTGKIISNPPLEVPNIISVLMLHYSKYENKASTQNKTTRIIMPPPSTSTKPRVELGELRRTQTMPSAIAHLQGSDPFSSPWRCWAVLCCEGSAPRARPSYPLLAKRSSDQSLPLLVRHTRDIRQRWW